MKLLSSLLLQALIICGLLFNSSLSQTTFSTSSYGELEYPSTSYGGKGKGYTASPTTYPTTYPSPAPTISIGAIKPISPFSTLKECNIENSSCNLTVEIECIFYDSNREKRPCTTVGTTKQSNQTPFLIIEDKDCKKLNKKGTQMEITYKMCNKNRFNYKPRSDTRIQFLQDNNVSPANWRDPIGPDECRKFTYIETSPDFCKKSRGIEIFIAGELEKEETPKYCQCYLYKRSLIRINEPLPDCDEKQVVITEIASPFDEPEGRYIELYFEDCKGKKLPNDVTLISWKHEGDYRNLKDSLLRALQRGRVREQILPKDKKVPDNGIMVACKSQKYGIIYKSGTCDAIGGSDSPADVDGTDTIAVKTQDGIRDIFGIPGKRGRSRDLEQTVSRQDFSGGRAVRRLTAENNKSTINPSGDKWVVDEWIIKKNQSFETMDPNQWIPIPNAVLLITEIIDPMIYSPEPRFVEVYAPNSDDHDTILDKDELKLVIFQGNSIEPSWDSAIDLKIVPKNGFFVVCNKQADIMWQGACTTIIDSATGVANSDGNDQIAVVNGDKNGYYMLDIFGKIGSTGSDTAHNFKDSRAARRRAIKDPGLKKWSKEDWIINISDGSDADPGEWRDPTQAPSNSPTQEIICDIFITELANPLNNKYSSYIEIKTTCPEQTISKPVYLLTLNNNRVKLQGFTVPHDGYIIICNHKNAFDYVYKDKTCDIEKASFFNSYHGYKPVSVIEDHGYPENLKYLDTYGHPWKMLEQDYVFAKGRAVRVIDYPHSIPLVDLSAIASNIWEVFPGTGTETATTSDMDPRDWKEIPMILIFTELADPVNNKSNRFIELYSPNKRNYMIKEELIVMKFHDNYPYPSSVHTSLKGLMINENGFLVLCLIWTYWGQNRCDDQVGYHSAPNSAGNHHYILAECLYPSINCKFIDVFGIPGTIATGSNHDFTNGRAVRRLMTTPMASKVFNPSQWYVVPGEGNLEVGLDVCDPGEWKYVGPYPTPIPTKEPSPAPTSKGKGKWKKKYRRR